MKRLHTTWWDPVVVPKRTRAMRPVQRTTEVWKERRWKAYGTTLEGYYRTHAGTFRGRITRMHTLTPEFYISDAPDWVVNGIHGACFFAVSPDTYRVHIHPTPPNADAGIIAIEHLIRVEAERLW